MSEDKNAGDKTEKPTPKRLADARKKGDVPKSKDVTSTVGLLGWVVMGGIVSLLLVGQILDLMRATIANVGDPSTSVIANLGLEAFGLMVLFIGLLAVPVILLSILTEFLQTGPILTFEKIKPNMTTLNPFEGFKRMFSMDNLVEVIKAVIKTALILTISGVVCWVLLPDIFSLTVASPAAVFAVLGRVALFGLAFTVAVFVLVALVDSAYQKYSHSKKLKMSFRDIREEMKDSEGNPEIKQQRRQLAQEWSQQGAMGDLSAATAVIMNPTHIAVALHFDADEQELPWIGAKGHDDRALRIRDFAEDAGVPILQNIPLAWDLDGRCQTNDPVPSDLYDVIAKVIVWAEQVRKGEVDPEDELDLELDDG